MSSPRQRALAFCDRFGLRAPIQAPTAGASPPALGLQVPGGQQRRLPDQPLDARPGAVRDAAHEDEVRAALASLGPEPPPVGNGLFVQDFSAQCEAILEAKEGDASRMQLWAGQGAAMARAEPAGEVVRRIRAEAEDLLPA